MRFDLNFHFVWISPRYIHGVVFNAIRIEMSRFDTIISCLASAQQEDLIAEPAPLSSRPTLRRA